MTSSHPKVRSKTSADMPRNFSNSIILTKPCSDGTKIWTPPVLEPCCLRFRVSWVWGQDVYRVMSTLETFGTWLTPGKLGFLHWQTSDSDFVAVVPESGSLLCITALTEVIWNYHEMSKQIISYFESWTERIFIFLQQTVWYQLRLPSTNNVTCILYRFM